MKKSKQLENRVKNILSENKKYQKSDNVLMARIWYDDSRKLNYGNIHDVSGLQFLAFLRDGYLTSWESVTRCRRKLQAKYPELRDEKTWELRHGKAEKMVKTKQYY